MWARGAETTRATLEMLGDPERSGWSSCVLGRRAGSEQYWSSQASAVWRRLCRLAVDTIPLKDSNRGRMRMLN